MMLGRSEHMYQAHYKESKLEDKNYFHHLNEYFLKIKLPNQIYTSTIQKMTECMPQQ